MQRHRGTKYTSMRWAVRPGWRDGKLSPHAVRKGIDIERCHQAVFAQDHICPLAELETNQDRISNQELLELDVDVLIPAALGEVIDDSNADQIKADIVIEAANVPVTLAAEEILHERGIEVVPDLLANGGGVIVSYLEWSQNHDRYTWKRKRVEETMEEFITSAWQTALEKAQEQKVDLRVACYLIAVERIKQALTLRGF